MKLSRLVKTLSTLVGLLSALVFLSFEGLWGSFIPKISKLEVQGILTFIERVERTLFETIHAQQQVYSAEEFSYSSLLLADSIITILKNYYVDSDRVANSTLLASVLNDLEETPGLKVNRHDDTFELKVGNKWINIDLYQGLNQDQLLNELVKISMFLDANLFTEKKKETQKGIYFTLRHMVAGLDAHSSILTRESYRDLREGTEGVFGGLGVLVGMRDDMLTVIKPLPRSPASRIGIKGKDRILAIDGKPTFGSSLTELVETMRGSPGTPVKLSLLRDEALVSREVEMTREVINVDSVTTTRIRIKNGFLLKVAIESFTSRTAEEIERAVHSFAAEFGREAIKGFILDLRSNPGGLLDQAVEVADLFLRSGVIVSTKGIDREIEHARDQGPDDLSQPVVVLINEDSASASEIVAGALQDHDRGLVVGQPSFGKGSVQTIFELPEKRALKLTIARYYTPSGASIQNVGIYPDVWLQPVLSKDKNLNLLGEYRYKTEKYLRRRLNSQIENQNFLLGAGKFPSLFKGYFFQEENNGFDPPALDYELEIASLIFSEIYSVYESSVPRENSRASHVLGIARRSLQKRLELDSSKVETLLKSNFSVDWAGDYRQILPSDLSYKTKASRSQVVNPGDELDLEFILTNTSVRDLNRLSIFIRGENPGFATNESLVGSIPAGASLTGLLKVEVPTYLDAQSLVLDFGVASDGVIVPHISFKIDLKVESRRVPELDVKVSLTGEYGANIDGVLESDERGKLLVEVTNHGQIDAGRLNVSLRNLAGQQVKISGKTKILEPLAAGKHAQIQFDLIGRSEIVSDTIDLGILIDGKSLNQPIKRRAALRSRPSVRKNAQAIHGAAPVESNFSYGGGVDIE